ncbi:Mur ligase [Mycena albidolilacea]|uniref:Mur ligase n=1 Tax=Mycena albidolilacea TaxID=1033008 RepID=A0AAD7EEK4_9AGAR|nr:Mur ligase [Mycena albidolilacea]
MVRLLSFLSRLPPPSPPPLQLALVQWRQHLFTPLQPPVTSAILRMVAQPYIRSSVFAIPEMIEYLGIIGYKPADLNALNVIHITGMKGKGSTSAFKDSILRETHPEWTTVWDRINENKTRVETTPDKPGYFRFMTLVAYHAFLSLKVDVSILEVGVGGAHDSTNIVPKPVEGVLVFTVDQPAEGLDVLRQRVKDLKSSEFNMVSCFLIWFDSDNTLSKIGCSVQIPVACAVSPDLVNSNNTPWKIGGSVPTPVACAVSPDLVDSDNTSWKILWNPVVEARAENVDSDNKSWEIHDTREEVDAANTSWTIGSNEARAVPIPNLVDGGSLTEVLLWPLWTIHPTEKRATAPAAVDAGNDSWTIKNVEHAMPTPAAVDANNDTWTIKNAKRDAPTPAAAGVAAHV